MYIETEIRCSIEIVSSLGLWIVCRIHGDPGKNPTLLSLPPSCDDRRQRLPIRIRKESLEANMYMAKKKATR